jgi:hypothetical protein
LLENNNNSQESAEIDFDLTNKNEEDYDTKLRKIDKLQTSDVTTILNEALSRKRLVYGTRDLLVYMFKCICYRSQSSLVRAQAKSAEIRKQFFFEKATDHLQRELDIKTLLMSIRKLKLLTSVIMDQRQRFLLKFQKKNVIATSSSGRDSESDPAQDHHRLIEHDDPIVRLASLAKMKHIISDYRGKKIEPVDRRLFRGIFIKTFKEFEEQYDE